MEKDWELRIFAPKLREVVKKYGITYDPNNPIPLDDSLANDIYKAAFELFVETGAYCVDSERIIKFDEKEVKEAVRFAPKKVLFGEGLDERELSARKPDDKKHPFCMIGGAGVPVSSNEVFISLVEAHSSIPETDSLTTPVLTSVSGLRIRPRSPLEMMGTIRHVVLLREATRRVGRPGLAYMAAVSTAESASSLSPSP